MSDRLLLVRHGVTTWNQEGRFQGRKDPPLADEGRLEARLLGERMRLSAGPSPMLIVTSPLARARDTARLLIAALEQSGTAPRTMEDERLVEIGQGEWEGRTHDELVRTDPQRYAAWASTDQEPPGAEPVPEALARVAGAADELARATETAVCLVSHGGILRLAARHLLSLDASHAWSMDVDNASLSELRRDEAGDPWRLVRWNDTSHLLGRTAQHVDEADGKPLAL